MTHQCLAWYLKYQKALFRDELLGDETEKGNKADVGAWVYSHSSHPKYIWERKKPKEEGIVLPTKH